LAQSHEARRRIHARAAGFFDPKLVIAEDLSHSEKEKRYFCFGRVGGGIMTGRFTWREGRIRIFGAGYWRKGRTSMSSRTVKYTKGEIGRFRIVENFLPPPHELVLREDNVKVTLSLSRRSIDFFKRAARQRKVPYQRMIRALVDAYAEKQERK
jgi:uncharacterized DUF497 family protein/predicted DNA binding CopG/RHH family protein